jgi:hypothetical protein
MVRNTLFSCPETSFSVMRIDSLKLVLTRTALIIAYGVFILSRATLIERPHTLAWNRCTRSICWKISFNLMRKIYNVIIINSYYRL